MEENGGDMEIVSGDGVEGDGEGEELLDDVGLEAEDYYASLFARCKPEQDGRVKLSVLLATLKELQALVLDSDTEDPNHTADSTCSEELTELRKVIDPMNIDLEISLNTFTKGMSAYLQNRQWSLLSPIKCNPAMATNDDDEDDDDNAQNKFTSSPKRNLSFGRTSLERRNSPSILDISHISHVPFDISLEAMTGSSSLSENGDPDWRAEVSDLHLQVQKLNDDNDKLKSRVSAAQEENFTLLQGQREELDRKDQETKVLNERIKRLEREVVEKNSIISSLEDKSLVLGNRNTRLENDCVAYHKERKSLISENEELRVEVKKTLRLLTSRDELVTRLKAGGSVAEKQWEEKEKWLNVRNDILTHQIEQLTEKVEKLEVDKVNLETKIAHSKSKTASIIRKSLPPQYPRQRPVLATGPHNESFELDISTEDIETELLAAEGNLSSLQIQPTATEKFDVATQCDYEQTMLELLEKLHLEVNQITAIFESYCDEARSASASASSSTKGEGNEWNGEVRNGSGSAEHKCGSNSKRQKYNNDGEVPGQMSESCATEVVRQINEELAEFRHQLKKSQELFTVLRYNSCQSVSLTKSCPGLVLPPSDSTSSTRFNSIAAGTNGSVVIGGKSVSCGTQTDSPVIETPVLAQKLCLVPSSPLPSGAVDTDPFRNHHHQTHRSHQFCPDGDFPHFMNSDNLDNLDKLSDDGSVRVRDDLSMVLEVSEQETETSPGAVRRSMSGEKGRPKLQRWPNTREEEEPSHHSNSGSVGGRKGSGGSRGHGAADVTSSASGSSGGGANGGNNGLGNHLTVDEGIVGSDMDYVSATSSQAESVYLSLERPLKVTVGSSSKEGSGSGQYRSCASSLRSARSGSAHGLGVSPAADCDTASVVSEGNTTFGSPLSSPSSPYWTPSQGSSSQETITPLDGDRTPVNEPLENEGPLDCNNISPSDIGETLRFPAEPSDLQKGRIRDSQMQDMYRRTYDCVARAVDKEARCLDTKEWQQLRKDKDHSDKELYRKTFAQEEGNEDDGAVGVDASGPSEYAFKLDEQAESYLEILPELAERLFQALDVIQEKKEAPTNQDMEDLERKFNHMAEVFQTEHTNLDQRMVALSRELKESQVNLKDISQSLKFSVAKLKEISNSTVVMPAAENLLDVMKTLGSTSDEFELYSSAMYRNARRMGMMDVQNRLHKMLDVMILYVHIIRTKYDNLKSDFDSLQTDFVRARELLKENNITFTPNHSIGSLQNNNNIDEKQGVWDEGELESSHSDRFDDGESEPEKILRHLLGPKKSSAGLSRNKDILTLKQKKTNENVVVRYLSEGYEVWRRELFWPWNLEQTMKGLKQGFSVMLMILGLFVFLRGFLPSVSAIDDGCITNPSFFKGAGAYFSHCGHLSHDDAPVI